MPRVSRLKKRAREFISSIAEGIEVTSRELVQYFFEECGVEVHPRTAAEVLNELEEENGTVESRTLTGAERDRELVRKKWRKMK